LTKGSNIAIEKGHRALSCLFLIWMKNGLRDRRNNELQLSASRLSVILSKSTP